MLEPTRIISNVAPKVFVDLGNGYWYYNYDINSTDVEVSICPLGKSKENYLETRYNYIQTRINGAPTYEKCVRAIVRRYIDQEDEFDLINSYNSYQVGIAVSSVEYESYLELLREIKEKVGKDFLITPSITTYSSPKQSDIAKFVLMAINTMSLTDSQSLSVKSLYPEWNTFIGQTVQSGIKMQYEGKLFKVIQEHLVQEQYPPSIETASLYTEIVEEHSGTIDDPIPYPADGNMTIYNGKYYTEDGQLYRCIRDSGQPLYAKLSTMVGNYVELV